MKEVLLRKNNLVELIELLQEAQKEGYKLEEHSEYIELVYGQTLSWNGEIITL